MLVLRRIGLIAAAGLLVEALLPRILKEPVRVLWGGRGHRTLLRWGVLGRCHCERNCKDKYLNHWFTIRQLATMNMSSSAETTSVYVAINRNPNPDSHALISFSDPPLDPSFGIKSLNSK